MASYPVVAVTIDGKEHLIPCAQGDYVRLEQETKTSLSRTEFSVSTIVTLAYFAARRTGVIGPDVTLDWWIDNSESHLADVEGEGKASGQDQPTG